jgi:hypothetical protein
MTLFLVLALDENPIGIGDTDTILYTNVRAS